MDDILTRSAKCNERTPHIMRDYGQDLMFDFWYQWQVGRHELVLQGPLTKLKWTEMRCTCL